MRLTKSGWVNYGIGKASGKGYGAVVHVGKFLYYRYGQWASEIGETFSSNMELSNLVDTLEEFYDKGLLKNCELFLYTDNMTLYQAYNKGTSCSNILFSLILRLRKIKMKGYINIHILHTMVFF